MNKLFISMLHKQSKDGRSVLIGMLVGALGFLSVLMKDNLSDMIELTGESPIAFVNGASVSRDAYLNQLQSLSSDKRNPIDQEDADFVLQRMIEEELLVQRALEIQLYQTDKQSRSTLVASMISMITAEANSYAPSHSELQDFFKDNKDYFQIVNQYKLSKYLISDDASQSDVQAIKQFLNGVGALTEDLKDKIRIDRKLPNTFMPLNKVKEYLGPTLTRKIKDSKVGDYLWLEEQQEFQSFITINEIKESKDTQLDQIKSIVEAEYIRRKGDQALREYLDWLQGRADIVHQKSVTVAGQ